jgi:hypothetical protein
MKDDLLRNPNHTGHLLAAALKRHKGKPVLFLGDTTLTGGQFADRISQYIQAFRTRGGRRVAEHPSVAQVCVIGTPDEKWGEAVTAVVVLRPDAPSDEASVATMTSAIQAAVKERKGSVQSPKQVVVVDSLPLTALGKPDEKTVRAKFWAGADRAVG